MEFHHLGIEQKVVDISRLVSRGDSIVKIDREIAKCEVLCANCHAEFHWFDSHPNEVRPTDYMTRRGVRGTL